MESIVAYSQVSFPFGAQEQMMIEAQFKKCPGAIL